MNQFDQLNDVIYQLARIADALEKLALAEEDK